MTLHRTLSKWIVGPSVRLAQWSASKVEKCSTFQAATDPLANQIAFCKYAQIHCPASSCLLFQNGSSSRLECFCITVIWLADGSIAAWKVGRISTFWRRPRSQQNRRTHNAFRESPMQSQCVCRRMTEGVCDVYGTSLCRHILQLKRRFWECLVLAWDQWGCRENTGLPSQSSKLYRLYCPKVRAGLYGWVLVGMMLMCN